MRALLASDMPPVFAPLRQRSQALLRRVLAANRLSLRLVCEESRPGRDYHTARDDDGSAAWHARWHRCRRCGQHFPR